MKNFDIAKYLKEHKLGPYGMLGGYVDIKPIQEVEVPYEGADPKLTGMGEGDKFDQAETVSEEKLNEIGLEDAHAAIEYLKANGFTDEEIKQIPTYLDLYNNTYIPSTLGEDGTEDATKKPTPPDESYEEYMTRMGVYGGEESKPKPQGKRVGSKFIINPEDDYGYKPNFATPRPLSSKE